MFGLAIKNGENNRVVPIKKQTNEENCENNFNHFELDYFYDSCAYF